MIKTSASKVDLMEEATAVINNMAAVATSSNLTETKAAGEVVPKVSDMAKEAMDKTSKLTVARDPSAVTKTTQFSLVVSETLIKEPLKTSSVELV